MDLANIRSEYTLQELHRNSVEKHPIAQFKKWFAEALKAEVPEANMMDLATVSAEGRPSSRIVLLKGIEDNGFVFYTNYNSKKATNIAQNPFVSLNFHWVSLERQIRIEGKVEKVSSSTSDEYFQTRPRGSQVSAWASKQSAVIPNREYLEEREETFSTKYENQAVPRPENWGGYIVIPDNIEFWQGRANRLHDRIVYSLEGDNWNIERLSP